MINTDPFWIGFFSVISAVLAALAVVYAARRASRSADKADRRDTAVRQDQLNLDQFQELANQNRLDRQEMRDERKDLVERVENLESKITELRQKVSDLEFERAQDRQQIALLKIELAESEKIRQALVRYVRKLLRFVDSLKAQAPEPDDVLNLE